MGKTNGAKAARTKAAPQARHTAEDVRKVLTKQWKTLAQIREESGACINTVRAAIRGANVETRQADRASGQPGRSSILYRLAK